MRRRGVRTWSWGSAALWPAVVALSLMVSSAMALAGALEARADDGEDAGGRLPTPSIFVSGLDTGRSATDGITSDARPYLYGRGPGGGTVVITDRGGWYATVYVRPDGIWWIRLDLSDRGYRLAAYATRNGRRSDLTPIIELHIDTEAPEKPRAGLDPDFRTGRGYSTTSSRTPRIIGAGEPGTRVEVLAGKRVIASANVHPQGGWGVALPQQKLGRHTYQLRSVDVAGNRSKTRQMSINVVRGETISPEPEWSHDLGGLDGNNGSRFNIDLATELSSIGDVNGDGFDDFAVTHTFDGTAVVFGRAEPFPAIASVAQAVATGGFLVTHQPANGSSEFAEAVGLGDVNGDGVDDFGVQVLIYGYPEPNRHAFIIVYGRRAGFPSQINLATLPPAWASSLTMPDEWAAGAEPFAAPKVMAGIGDFNGDRIGDLALGVPDSWADGICSSPGVCGGSRGNVFVVYGRLGGFGAGLDVSALDGANGFRLAGFTTASPRTVDLGRTVVGAGDVNGDGLADLAIGSPGTVLAPASKGAAFVVFGRRSVPAVLSVATLDGATGFRAIGRGPAEEIGRTIAAVGDVNGDGVGDLAFGRVSTPEAPSGLVQILFGRSSFPSILNLSTLAGTTGSFIAAPTTVRGSLGHSIVGMGDMNGDGLDDIAVATRRYLQNRKKEAVYVVYGRRVWAGVRLARFGAGDGIRLLSEEAEFFFTSLMAGAGDVNGDHRGDLLVGGEVSSSTAIYLVRGGHW